ncbi:MAG: D-2-hydroxyacid dehydrogenase family protein [alpha proteobacterium HIMB114]|nr:MAG: D-2-hydroxyacid dehydrogenase family protein [alpha proteobacterium HIMB114]|tara:strand:- start:186 stop:1133 length:948 start_codon:yes stop_codon:yes gene_type:complete
MKVAIIDDYQGVAEQLVDWSKFKDSCEIKVFNQPFENEDHAIENLKSFNALLIMRERTPMTKKLMDGCPNLKFIATSGMRNLGIDLEHAKSKGIIVSGSEGNKYPTAELTWALILGLARNIKQESENMYQGYWQTTIGFELKGKTLGIMGLGNLGSMVAKVGKAFGMEVIAWSENLKLAHAEKHDVIAVTKEELFEKSDFLTIHYLLSDRSRNLVKYDDISKMKKTAFIINTSRGPIINEDDLIKALQDEIIAGAGLDVYEIEPLPENHKLRFLPNVLLTPHIGYVTLDNYAKWYNQMAEDLQAFLDGQPIRVLN